ncbi:NAD-dependent succinate-semialdehyde dehydrogenase [Halomarina oriensis]|uniref:Aldehyde dehydrogenase family protein n=1 Tax=Halomarina oriensis TaxID=671145 RepID=A0A6B0GTK3_9EURY|nr:NAD-dependent succinate-semialdehyde dehydrogenase [Halomarina oriensis]MWG35048.1 aldehyde dehydrogenase family protein [Halomarina oriensis]
MERENPATAESLDPIEGDTEADVEDALALADEVYPAWSERRLEERRQLLNDAAEVLRENAEEYAELMAREMGKPIAGGRSEVEKCAWVCEHYAEYAETYLADEVLQSAPEAKAFVSSEPLGPVLAVMPWNYPFWQVFRFAAPNLVAGNVGLLKHASNVPGCAQAIEEVFLEAGLPEGAFQSLLVGSDAIEDVVTDKRIRGVTLTGSESAGRAVAETAGKELKPSVLELGGSDPFVVLDDADVETAAEVGMQARTLNSGQSCIAAKRFIVHDAVYDEFVSAFVDEMAAQDIGDPTDDDTDIGPQAREDLMEDLHEQVTETLDAGATLETGGEPLDREGYFYPPTVVTDVPRDSTMATDEVFGPAAAVFRVESEDEAVELANDSTYGLGGSVWTEDLERGERVARRVESGCVFVNELTKSDPRIPFGGVKNSGYGRELSEHGMKEFLNEKTVWVQSAADQ